MKRPTRRFVEPPVFVSQSSSWLTYMLFEEESSSREDTTKGRQGGGEQRTLAEYLTTLRALGRRGGTVRARRRGPKSTAKRSREGAERDSSRAQRFLRLTSSRLAFYLGQTGIRLNALIKLLTSFGRPGGHRVSAGPRVGPFLPRRAVLPFIFVPSLRTANRNSYFTFDNRCFVRLAARDDRIVGQEFSEVESDV